LGLASNRFFLRWLGSPNPAAALTQVGLLSLGTKFGRVVNRSVNVPFNSYWGPRRFELLAADGSGSKALVARICTYATFISVFAALLLCAGAESLIRIVADARYHGAHVVVPFVALTYVVIGIQRHLSTGILQAGRTGWLTWIGLVSLAITLSWNYLLIPRFGLIGAVTSNLAAVSVRQVLIYFVGQRICPLPFEVRRIAVLLATACILYVTCLLVTFPSPYLTLLARVGLAATFPVALLGVGFYRSEEVRVLKQLLATGRTSVLQALNGR